MCAREQCWGNTDTRVWGVHPRQSAQRGLNLSGNVTAMPGNVTAMPGQGDEQALVLLLPREGYLWAPHLPHCQPIHLEKQPRDHAPAMTL